MTDEPSDDHAFQGLRNQIRALLEPDARDLPAVLRRADRIKQTVGEEVIRAVTPLLRAQAGERSLSTYDDKRAFCRWLNDELRRSGLAIRCPKTGKPTKLEVNPGHTPAVGRFRFDHMDEQGEHHTTFTSVELPPLEFVPDPSVTPIGRRRSARGR